MKNLKKVEAGKKGANKRWADRYQIILELSKFYNKEYQNKFLKWPTEHLRELLKHIKK